MEEIEHIIVDDGGFNSAIAFVTITPCSNYVSESGSSGNAQDQGEQTTAEWIRIVFHDIITGDLTSGLGGLDVSIGLQPSV